MTLTLKTEINNPIHKKRTPELDYMKGILIILTVLGHVNTPFTDYIYMFHMPCFFMISGYCWNKKHSSDFYSMKNYFIGKVKRLYVPFIIVNITFILLNNVFLKIGFITNNNSFLEFTSKYRIPQSLADKMGIGTMVKGIVKALFFSGGYARLCGVTWFLSSLFMVSIFHMILEFFIARQFTVKEKKKRIVVLFITIIVCLIFCVIIDYIKISIPGIIRRMFGCYVAYLIGVVLREIRIINYINPVSIFVCFFITVLFNYINLDTSIELSQGRIGNPVIYPILCLCGFIFCYGFAKLLVLKNIRIIEICGKESMSIMLFHCLSFKIVSLIYLIISKRPFVLLAASPALENENVFLPFFYLFIGVFVPLGGKLVYDKIKCLLKLREERT